MIHPKFIKYLLSLLIFLFACSTINAEEKKILKRWEKVIQNFEMMDKQNPPPKNPILFIGASNFRRWDLKKNFSDLPTVNRAFGGSMLSESIFYIDRIVYPYNPKTIILYAGANDMSRGRKTPLQVLESYQEFVKLVHKKFPETRIVFLSLPYFYRYRDMPEKNADVTKVNQLILDETKKDDLLDFVEINEAMKDSEGKPRKDLFTNDGIHVNQDGYDVWAEKLRPFMIK